MGKKSKTRCIGILTSGGDCPGLNAAIRAVAKAAMTDYGMDVIGIYDGFRGLVENRYFKLDNRTVSGILTLGGTILGTSRDKPNKMVMGGKKVDMTEVAVENAKKMGLDCLVCLGGGGTQKNALHLMKNGLNVLTLPKTIDNDVYGTDVTFGFDTALTIASEAIDRLHTTATSHHRLIVCEIMGHNAGWLPLGAGIAGGADVILIPEIPYNLEVVAEHLRKRRSGGKRFSIIAIAEGATSVCEGLREKLAPVQDSDRPVDDEDAAQVQAEVAGRSGGKVEKKKSQKNGGKKSGKNGDNACANGADGAEAGVCAMCADEMRRDDYAVVQEPVASRVAREIQRITGFEARVTSLGHVQRGGTPSPRDRLLCTILGTKAAQLLAAGDYNCMVAVRGDGCKAVPLEDVAGKRKAIPDDHPWLHAAQMVETCLGR